MPINRYQLTAVLAITTFYFVGQLLTGTKPLVSSLFSLAILFGILAIYAGDGIKSPFGCLNALLIGKFLLFGIAVKILLWEPADGTLKAPTVTAMVLAVGFFAVFLGTAIQFKFRSPKAWSINQPYSSRMLISFSLVLFVLSYVAYFASQIPDTQGQGLQTGGLFGVARMLASLKALSIVPPMLYLWQKRTRLWMTHPLVLGMLVWAILIGIFSTGKLEAMEPLVLYMLLGFLRYGFLDMRLWGLVAVGCLYYALIVFPYSQYVRSAGAREGSFNHRFEVTKDVFLRIADNEDFRSTVTEDVSKAPYFTQERLAPFSRLAMVGEADRLVYATLQQQAFTRWTTIVWGFKLLTPSFLYPDKPVWEAGNYLAHIVGDVAPSDKTTQMSYGIMANLYNAFSLPGVLIGTSVFFAGFYYLIRVILGEPKFERAPTTSTFWFICVIALYQHSIVESSLSGNISSLAFPVVVVGVNQLARGLCPFIPTRRAWA